MHASQELDSHSQPNPQEEAHVLGEDDEQEEPVQQMHEEIQQKEDRMNECDEEGDELEDRIEKEEVDQIRTEESKQEEEEEPENEMLVDSEYNNIPTVKY